MGSLIATITDPARADALSAALGPAVIGGLLPALVWLAFWLREDRERPEPRRIVFTTFLLGVVTIPGTMVVQMVASQVFLHGANIEQAARWAPLATFATLAVWVLVEEVAKVLAAYSGGLSRRESDEPIDAAIYLIAAALGFSAAENFLYLFADLFFHNVQTAAALANSSTRAIGATTLHVAIAAMLGVFGGFARYATPTVRRLLWSGGFALAVLLHLAYNALIIFGGESHAQNAASYAIAWSVSLVAILALEKVKAMRVESGERAQKQLD
jgi:RsiW-degrading membrane proteinase PrsW (M82 family)